MVSTPSCDVSDPPSPLSGLAEWARTQPGRTALVWPGRGGVWRTADFAALERACRDSATALHGAGVRSGQRAVVMTRDPYDLVTTVYGLLALGAVPVLVDPGLPRPMLRTCLDEARPETFIGEPLAHVARTVFGWARPHVRTVLVTGRSRVSSPQGPGPSPDVDGRSRAWPGPPPPRALALIAFTSGSTGPAKGVEYRHGQLAAQVRAIGDVLGLAPGEVLLAGFLPFVLFGPATGATTVVPAVDHRRPSRTPGAALRRAVTEQRVTVVCASPAVLRALAAQCVRERADLPSVARVCSFGAPPEAGPLGALRRALPPGASVFSAYGATECLPVSVIDSVELDAAHADPRHVHQGFCLGRPVPGVGARILRTTDTAVPRLTAGGPLPPGRAGEIAVIGPAVSAAYHARPRATEAAKVDTADGPLHRTGDLGWLDDQGRLWFLGRAAHRVRGAGFDLDTAVVERLVAAVPGVRRCALLGIGPAGDQRAVLCLELARGATEEEVRRELRRVLARLPRGRRIGLVLVRRRLPMDVRHNSRVDRARLARWAARRAGWTPDTGATPGGPRR